MEAWFVNNPQDPNHKQVLEDYEPESREVEIEDLRRSENFYIKRFADAVYYGECIRSPETNKLVRQGKGFMRDQNNRVYEGEWLNDCRHGRGYERYPNGNIYQGQFKNGKAHGHGHYSWVSSGEIYDG